MWGQNGQSRVTWQVWGESYQAGAAVLLQESHCSHIGRQHGAEEVTEEEEEAW